MGKEFTINGPESRKIKLEENENSARKYQCPRCNNWALYITRHNTIDNLNADPKTNHMINLWRCKACGGEFRELLDVVKKEE